MFKLKIVSVPNEHISAIESLKSRIQGDINQVLIFDKDYNLVDPKLPISSPIYNWDMLQVFSALLVNAENQNRLVVIDTSNSALSVSHDIITDTYKFISSNYASMLPAAFSRLWVYAGPLLFSVHPSCGDIIVSEDYGTDTALTVEQCEEIKSTIDRIFNEIEEETPNLLNEFRTFIHGKSQGYNLPFKRKGDVYVWDIPFNVNGILDLPLSLHLRTNPKNVDNILQVTIKELIDKKTGNCFINQRNMPEGLRAWLLSYLKKSMGETFQIIEGGKTSINFNLKGFDTKINAIMDVYSRLRIDPRTNEIIYIGDEAKILPDGHPGNDAIVFGLKNISLINTGSLHDGSKSLGAVKLSQFGLSKGRDTKLFNVNLSNSLKQKSSLQVTLELIRNWFL